MIPILDTDRVALVQGDCLEVLRALDADSIDAVVTDPPYGLSFMGKAWDYDVPKAEVWAEVLRVLKPGGHLLSFFGSRTYHRGVVQIEDAGFEVRDSLIWMYGTGFPKSLNVGKAIDSARTEDAEPVRVVCRYVRAAMDAKGLKSRDLTGHFGDCNARLIDHWAARDTDSQPNLPTWEQWLKLREVLGMPAELDAEVARLNGRKGEPGDTYKAAPIVGAHAGQTPGFVEHRFGTRDNLIRAANSDEAAQWEGWGTALKPAHEPIVLARKPLIGTVAANVLAHGTGGLNIDGCRIGTASPRDEEAYRTKCASVVGLDSNRNGSAYGEWKGERGDSASPSGRWPANVLLDEEAAAMLDAQSGTLKAGVAIQRNGGGQKIGGQGIYQGSAGLTRPDVGFGDSGGASRFFYCAKAGKAERERGCAHLPEKSGGEATDREDGSIGVDNPRAGAGRGGGRRNFHPTVKPVALMRWLVRLVTPPGGTVLDPFTGSGTTGIAALEEGFNFFGIERDAEYCEIAKARTALADSVSVGPDSVSK